LVVRLEHKWSKKKKKKKKNPGLGGLSRQRESYSRRAALARPEGKKGYLRIVHHDEAGGIAAEREDIR